jgi:spore coat polysaccharide biosynthesis protein SpsF
MIELKVICIVQARMGSERLPGKVIKHIKGKPMILYTLERLCRSRYIDKIIMATSTKESEIPLVEVCESAGYEVFRGDENNVLKRYKDAVDSHTEEECVVIRVTGDCPLIDPVIVDNVVSNFLMNDYDYVRLDVPDTFVRGFDVEVFSSKALKSVYEKVNDNLSTEYEPYREHVTFYIYRHPQEYKIGVVKGEALYNKEYRLCVDTPEDFELVSDIFEYFDDEYVPAREVVNYLDKNLELALKNNSIKQKQL